MKNQLRNSVAVLAVGAASIAQADTVAFQGHSSDPANVITNEVHYAKPFANISRDDVVRYWSEYQDLTVNVPEDVTFESWFRPSFFIGNNHRTVMNITGTWGMADSDTTYAEYSMEISSMLSLHLNGGDDRKRGAFRFSDGVITLSKNAAGTDTEVDFNGSFNFLDPNGVNLYDNYLYMNQSATGTRTAFSFSGGCFTAPIMMDYGETATNEYDFTGGSHYIRRFIMRDHNAGGPDTYDKTRLCVSGEGTHLKLYNFETQTGVNRHGYSVRVQNGGALEFRGKIEQQPDDPWPFVFDGGNLVVTNQAANDAYWYRPVIAATNAVFTMTTHPGGGTGESNRLQFLGAGSIYLKDTVYNAYATIFDTDMTMEGGTYTAAYCTKVGGSSYGQATVIFRNAAVDFGTGTDFAVGTGSDTSKVVIDGTTVATANNGVLGQGGASLGTLEVRGGSVTFANRLVLGASGRGMLTVSGGKVKTKDFYTQWNSGSVGKISGISMTGGEFEVTGAFSTSIAGDSVNCGAEIVLDGGNMKVPYIGRNRGTLTLSADGGTITANADSDNFLRGLTAATLGEDGLTVDANGHNLTITNEFSSGSGVIGKLAVTGTGVKTLPIEWVDKLAVSGGRVDLKGAYVGLLELGDTVFRVPASSEKPCSCNQAPVITSPLKLALPAGCQLGDSFVLFTCDQISESTSVGNLSAAVAVENLPVGAIPVVAYDDDAGGYKVTLRVPTGHVISLAEGSSFDNEDRDIPSADYFDVQIGTGAALTLSGVMKSGELRKSGDGKLTLASSGNLFTGGIISYGKWLSADSIGALGYISGGLTLAGGTFEYLGTDPDNQTYGGSLNVAAANAADAVIIKTDYDFTLSGAAVTQGDLIKRGVGKLTIAPGPGTTTVLTHDNGHATNGWDPDNYSTAFAFPEDGSAPDHGYLGFNIAEGEVVLKGDSTTVFTGSHGVMVGMNTSDCLAAPKLTIDGATVTLSNGANPFMFSGYTSASCTEEGTAAEMSIINGATFNASTFITGRSGAARFSSVLTVDNATFNVGSYRPSYYSSCTPLTIVRNNGRINASAMYTAGPSYFAVTNGAVVKNAAGDCFKADVTLGYGGRWLFGPGSTLAMNWIAFTKANANNPLILDFDGGTWNTGDDTDHATFHLLYASNLVVRASGTAGLTLPVSAAKTVNVARAITGEGPLVKTGAGTLNFETQGTWNSDLTEKTALEDGVSLALEGALDVREGAVTIASGACRTGGEYLAAVGTSVNFGGNSVGAAKFSGAGTYLNATATGATIAATATAHPVFDGVTFADETSVDLSALVNPQVGDQIVVASFTGETPAITGWKVLKNGSTRATLSVVGGNVVATITARSGSVLIFQ